MPEKNEPLNESKRFWVKNRGVPLYAYPDVKSAVRGLIKEIIQEIEYWEKSIKIASGLEIAFLKRRIATLEWCIEKIKKWFPDVFEEVENEQTA
ncbi:MAG: hypothetical protein DRP12_00270 [Candidatus Aenigmatarchaeota archaeon]|nr:MAG: hypothetical protein DRP12_00270 [Candidatus Aenigmarchaeota archaeon]